jgi:hypothetical protein
MAGKPVKRGHGMFIFRDRYDNINSSDTNTEDKNRIMSGRRESWVAITNNRQACSDSACCDVALYQILKNAKQRGGDQDINENFRC